MTESLYKTSELQCFFMKHIMNIFSLVALQMQTLLIDERSCLVPLSGQHLLSLLRIYCANSSLMLLPAPPLQLNFTRSRLLFSKGQLRLFHEVFTILYYSVSSLKISFCAGFSRGFFMDIGSCDLRRLFTRW